MAIHIITGNVNKLKELEQVFPSGLDLVMTKLELDEIQTLDTKSLVQHKLKQAFAKVNEPVVVEDVSAELEMLNGLPGPFVKYFEQQMGRGALYKLSHEGAKLTIRCVMGYYDGNNEYIVEGIVNGKVTAPRDGQGFGFDYVFVPDGFTKTYSEMGAEQKNSISHRYLAAKNMVTTLQSNNIL